VTVTHAYPAFYTLGFVVAALVAWRFGRRSGLEPRTWAMLLAVTAVGGVIGSRVLHFDLVIAGFGDRTFLGGLVGGALTFMAASRLLALDGRGGDALAVAVPLGHAVGRVGCHLVGCCFGRPTTLPWGIHHTPGTGAHHADLATVSVHPVQLYEVGVQLALAALAWRYASRFRRRGSALLAVAGTYAATRVVLEGYRFDAWSQPGMTSTQWLASLLAGAAFGWLIWRERSGEAGLASRSAGRRPAIVAAAAVPPFLFMLRGEGFTQVELVVVAGAVMAMVPWAIAAVHRMTVRTAWVGATPAVAGLFVLQAAVDTAADRRPFTTVGVAGTTGSYVESCGGARRVGAVGVSVARTTPMGAESWVVARAQGFVGSDEDLGIGGVGFTVAAEGPWVGAGIGLLAGSVAIDGGRESVFPAAHLRLGRRESVFLEGRLAEHEPVGLPIPAISLGIGVGVGGGSTAGLGIGGSGFYGTGRFMSGAWEFEPYLAAGDADIYQLSFAVRKRLGTTQPTRAPGGQPGVP
jgi:phosphatidylglycerol---prolipoprotein diacylglyceryl transferase